MSWSRPPTVGELGLCGTTGDDFTWRAADAVEWPPPAEPFETTITEDNRHADTR